MILICKSCENTCEKLVNLSYSDSQCSIVAKALKSTETFLKSNKLAERLALSPVQNQHCLLTLLPYLLLGIMPFKAIQTIFWLLSG